MLCQQDEGWGKIEHEIKSSGTSTPQMMAQNFFLQIKTCSGMFFSFSNVWVVTSHRNFGARSLILERVVFSSLIMIKPWMSKSVPRKNQLFFSISLIYISLLSYLISCPWETYNATQRKCWMAKKLSWILDYISLQLANCYVEKQADYTAYCRISLDKSFIPHDHLWCFNQWALAQNRLKACSIIWMKN